MMVAGTYILTDTIDRSFDEIFTESNEGIDAVVTSKEAVETDDGQVPPFDAAILEPRPARPTASPRRRAGSPTRRSRSSAPTASPSAATAPRRFGFSTGPERFDPLTYVEGGPPQADDEVVIDKASAEDEGFEVGDTVEIAGKEAAKELHARRDRDARRRRLVRRRDDRRCFTLPEAQRITGKEGQFDPIIVAADPGTSPERARRATSTQVLPEHGRGGDRRGEHAVPEGRRRRVHRLPQDGAARLRRRRAVRRRLPDLQHLLDHRRPAHARVRDAAHAWRQPAPDRHLGGRSRPSSIGLVASAIGVLAGIGFAPAISALFEALEIDLPDDGHRDRAAHDHPRSAARHRADRARRADPGPARHPRPARSPGCARAPSSRRPPSDAASAAHRRARPGDPRLGA